MADRFVMLVCNPRLDAGVFVTPPKWVSAAVLAQPDAVRMVEAEAKRQYDAIFLSKGEIQIPLRERVRLLLTEQDALVSGYDLLPAILFYTGRAHEAHA
jgi:hypothetical protein